MIRTTSIPKQTVLPDLDTLSLNPEVPIPGILSHPSLLRPKPRKPTQPVSPSPPQLQLPNQSRQRRTPQIPGRRRRAHSRASDAGWLTDEIVGGQVDDFDFAGNLGKFDKRRDWEEFRVPLSPMSSLMIRKWILRILLPYWYIIIVRPLRQSIRKHCRTRRMFWMI
jgi:hypothetical protein